MRKIILACAFLELISGFSIKESCVYDKVLDLPVELPHNFYCDKVNFDQNLEPSIIIPDQKFVVFQNSHILWNADFLHRFPNCSEMYFDKVHLELDETIINSYHLLSSLFLNECDISGNLSVFATLPNLKQFEAFHNNIQGNVIENSFLGNNVKVVTLFQNNLQGIRGNIFEGLSNIEMLTLSENLESLTSNLSEMNRLMYLDLSGNHLSEVPCRMLPENLKQISFPSNNIQSPNFNGCTFLGTLERLDLSGNGIELLDSDVFNGMTSIQEIYLSHNVLSNLTDTHFKNLDTLKKVALSGNSLHWSSLKLREGVEAIK